MAFRLARIPRDTPIVDPKTGKPTLAFQIWWQGVVEQIEASVTAIEGNIEDIRNIVEDIQNILVRLGLAEITADGALTLASSAINPDSTIKDDKVLTQSMVADAASAGYYAQLASYIWMPDGVDTVILSQSFTKELPSPIADPIEGSDVIIDATLRMESSNDIVGRFSIYRDGGPGVGTLIDTVDWDTRLNGSIAKLTVPYGFVDDAAGAGPRSYFVSFKRNGGGSAVAAIAGSLIRTLERKR